MRQEEQETQRELKKDNKSLKAMIERRDKKADDYIRNEDYLKSVISGLEDDKIKLESKIVVLMRKSIDDEMIM